MTDGVTDDIIWIQGTRMAWLDTRLGLLKNEKTHTSDICFVYIISYIYIIYLICILYNVYITYISKVKSV